jgi:spore coat protein H
LFRRFNTRKEDILMVELRVLGKACALAGLGLTLLVGCANRPEGWSDASHGENAPADYNTVFPQDRVVTMDIEVSANDWQAIFDDMTDMAGSFGTGVGMGGGGNQPPPQVPGGGQVPGGNNQTASACSGKKAGDSCTVGNVSGSCVEGMVPGQLLCIQAQGNQGAGMNDDQEFFPRTPRFVPCTVSFEGRKWYYVGLRLKGNSTLSTGWQRGVHKLPWRLDFDELEDSHPEIAGQRFHGFKLLSLTSNSMDASFQRERLADELLAEAGVPVGRATFLRLFINHGDGRQYFGLYTMVEIPDRPLLLRVFADDRGNLYKPEGRAARWVSFDRASFDKHTNKAAADWSDVEAAVQALNADRSDAARWRAGLEAVFNVDGFLRWIAMNTVISNWDAYGSMAHNYFLYASPSDRDRLQWIAWDNDLAFGAGGGGGFQLPTQGLPGGNQIPGGQQLPGGQIPGGGRSQGSSVFHDETTKDWPLIRFLLDDPVYRAAYRAHLEDILAQVFIPDRINARIIARQSLIAPYVIGAEGEQPNYTFLSNAAEFEQAVSGSSGLLGTVTRQAQVVRDALEAQR